MTRQLLQEDGAEAFVPAILRNGEIVKQKVFSLPDKEGVADDLIAVEQTIACIAALFP